MIPVFVSKGGKGDSAFYWFNFSLLPQVVYKKEQEFQREPTLYFKFKVPSNKHSCFTNGETYTIMICREKTS